MGIDLDFGTLFAGIVFGCIGFGAWRWGKRQQSARGMLIGIALMVFPYFVPGGLTTWAVGGVLTAALFYP